MQKPSRPAGLRRIMLWAAILAMATLGQGCGPKPETAEVPNARRAGEKEVVWLADGAEMVLVPEGLALVPEFDPEKPRREMTLPAFYVDKYEVTNARFLKFINTVTEAPEKYLAEYPEYNDLRLKEGRWEIKPGRENFPAAVTFEGAVAFCRWAGKELPDWPQFMRAACGDDGRKFPWGNEWDPSRSVCSASQRSDKGFGPLAVGSRPTGVSPFGAHDMAGNMQEWVRVPDGFRSRSSNSRPDVPDRALAGSGYEGDSGGDVDECFGSLGRAVHMSECSLCAYGQGFRCVVPAERVRAADVVKTN